MGEAQAPAVTTVPSQSPGATAQKMLPGAKANAAARAGGGISPNFLAGVVNAEGGTTGGLDIIDQIRQSLGAQG